MIWTDLARSSLLLMSADLIDTLASRPDGLLPAGLKA